MITRLSSSDSPAMPQVKTSRRGRSISRYFPTWSISSPRRRTRKEKEPPTRASTSMRSTSSSRRAGPNIHLPIITGSSQASKTRSGAALKWRVTWTLTLGSVFIVILPTSPKAARSLAGGPRRKARVAFRIHLLPTPRSYYDIHLFLGSSRSSFLLRDWRGLVLPGPVLFGPQKSVESIQPSAPDGALFFDPGRGVIERLPVERKEMLPPRASASHQTSPLEHAYVLRDSVE